MKFKTQLFLLFLIVMIGMTGGTGYSQYQLERVYTATNFSNANSIPSVAVLDQALDELTSIRVKTWQYMAMTDKSIGYDLDRSIDKARESLSAQLSLYYQYYVTGQKDLRLLENDFLVLQAYDELREKALRLAKEDKKAEAFELIMSNQEVLAKLYKTFQAHRDYNVDLGQKSSQAALDLKRSTMWLGFLGCVLTILVVATLFWIIARNVLRQIGCEPRAAAAIARRISAGDLTVTVDTDGQAESSMVVALKAMVGNIKTMLDDANALSKAAMEGRLATRADAARHQGDYRLIVQGINETLDAIISPIGQVQQVFAALAKGDLTQKINQNYQGDFAKLRDDANTTVDSLAFSVTTLAKCVERIAKGDIPPKITDTYPGDFNAIKNILNLAIDNVNALIADSLMLSEAAVEGKLSTRADASKHQGDYRKIVQGVNDTLDAVIGPLNMAADHVDRIAKGDIPPKITDSYNGDFNIIKNNLNLAIDNVNAMVADSLMLSEAAVEGKLSTRADASKHQGDYRKIVQGVNQTLDAVIGPLNVAASYVDRIAKGDIPPKITDSYQGDFNTIKNNLNLAVGNVNALVADVNLLSKAAVEGELSTRADTSKHQGDYRLIVQGINETLDAIIDPIGQVQRVLAALAKGDLTQKISQNYQGDFAKLRDDANTTVDSLAFSVTTIANYVDRIGKGDIPPKITDTYLGDFSAIKNNLNLAFDNVNALVADALMLSEAAVEGKLATRADASRHHGDYRRIVQGVNDTLDAIVGPVGQVQRVLGALAKGDLTEKIAQDYRGDFSRLRDDANTTVDTLAHSVTTIKEASDAINSASKDIASGNADLSQRTEEQASSLEETASSMEELASTVRQNADNARQANQMSAAASEVATKGGAVMRDVVATMNDINDSSRKIVEIISVIDGIAFQTNILALNAAVEAARAGEQGRGFAVVASEVRNLAQRSTAAAKEIKALIGDSVDKAEAGSRLVAEAGRTMEEIVTSVKRVTDIMGEIASASAEQSAGIEQVNQAITQMDDVTQQNAALVEEEAAAAESLEEQAEQLAALMARFRLDGAAVPRLPLRANA